MIEPLTLRVRLEDGTYTMLRLTGVREDLENSHPVIASFREPFINRFQPFHHKAV